MKVLRAAFWVTVIGGSLVLGGCALINQILGITPVNGDIEILHGSTVIPNKGSFDLGSLGAGQTGSPVVITLKNKGTATVSFNFTNPVHDDDTAQFVLPTPALGTTLLKPGDTTTFTITFKPASIASLSSAVMIETSEGQLAFTAKGTGTTSGTVTLTWFDGAGSPHVMSNGDTVPFTQLNGPGNEDVHLQVSNSSAQLLGVLNNGPVLTTNNTGNAFAVLGPAASPIDNITPSDVYIRYYYLGPARASDVESVELDTSDDSGHGVFTFFVSGSTS